MNSLNARESTLQRKGIKAKRANTNVTNAAKIDTRLSPGHSSIPRNKFCSIRIIFYSQFQCNPFTLQYQNMIGKAVLRIHKIIVNNKFIMYEKT